jgi:hypothetical protein
LAENFSLSPLNLQKIATTEELKACNEITVKFGLFLSDEKIHNLVEKRFDALKDTGRIEFGEGILKALIFEFCDSPYIDPDNYEEIIFELLDSFYYFKNESMDMISDDELMHYMKNHFDGDCEGSIDYLNGTALESLCRYAKGYDKNES